jgi:ABC-type transport system involved in multi-copper enzyme maturation permease subunit
MLSVPVIEREMLAAARSPLQYRVRAAVGCLALLFVTGIFTESSATGTGGLGLYTLLHGSVMAMILLVAPTLTADAISRERREGTLDLLFLTPLNGTRIVSSKLFSHTLRMVTIWLASLPMAVIPILSGGVSPAVIVLTLGFQFAGLLIGLGAGLTVSIFVRKTLPAIFCSIGLATLLISLNSWVFLQFAFRIAPLRGPLIQGYAALAISFIFPRAAASPAIFGGPMTMNGLIQFEAIDVLFVLLATIAWAFLLGGLLTRNRTSGGESARAAWFRRVFLTPTFFKDVLRRAMLRKIEQNPLIWLEYRSPWSRSARWTLVAALVLAESYMLLIDAFSVQFSYMQVIATLVLVLLICVTASSSFQREKENGAFELLLVAPLTEERLIFGRLAAVWNYYKPAAVVLLLFMISSLGNFERMPFSGAQLLSVCLSGITVPVAGLYFALTRKHFLVILASTAFCALLLPYFGLQVADWFAGLFDAALYGYGSNGPGNSVFGAPLTVAAAIFLHGGLIKLFLGRTLTCLRRRDFAL